MDFKVEVSLWTGNQKGADQTAVAGQHAAAHFQERLGQDPARPGATQAQDELPAVVERTRLAQLAETLPTHSWLSVNQPGAALKPGGQVAELYALGARAGHHLSYLAEPGHDDAVSAPVDTAAPAAEDTATLAALTAPPAPPALSPHTTVSAVLSTAGGAQQTPVESPLPAGEIRNTEAALPERWRERNVLLLPRGQGTEVVVRDYQLSEHEHDELLQDLLRSFRTLPNPPRQIWINGRSVWPAAHNPH